MKKASKLLATAIATFGLGWLFLAQNTRANSYAPGNWSIDPDSNRELIAFYPGNFDTSSAMIELRPDGTGFFLGPVEWKETPTLVRLSSEPSSLRRSFANLKIGTLQNDLWVLELHKIKDQKLQMNSSDGKPFLTLRKLE